MEQMIGYLKEIGLTDSEIERVCERYRDDAEGLRLYVAYMCMTLDDRREYV